MVSRNGSWCFGAASRFRFSDRPRSAKKKRITRAFYQLIGARIKKSRKLAGMTQSQLAKAVQVCRVYVAEVEAGRDRASLPLLLAMADELGIQGPWLIFGIRTP